MRTFWVQFFITWLSWIFFRVCSHNSSKHSNSCQCFSAFHWISTFFFFFSPPNYKISFLNALIPLSKFFMAFKDNYSFFPSGLINSFIFPAFFYFLWNHILSSFSTFSVLTVWTVTHLFFSFKLTSFWILLLKNCWPTEAGLQFLALLNSIGMLVSLFKFID